MVRSLIPTPTREGTRVSKFRYNDMAKKEPKIISVQVCPGFFDSNELFVGQGDGADERTTAYMVYERAENGSLGKFDEYPNERDAVNCAQVLAKKMGVPVEPYLWQMLKGPALKDQEDAFIQHAQDWDFIKDTQRYDGRHPDRANQFGHYDTQKAYTVWNDACAWMRKVFKSEM